MKKFMIMHFGFEKPSPEQMGEWKKWFESIADIQVDQQGFAGGREISKDGTKELGWDLECITGFNVVEAEDLDAAEKIAQGVPFVTATRVYELRSH